MGAQWKQAGREANAQKKGQMVAKLVRELMVAAKLGGADPDLNPRLAAAVEKARKASSIRTPSNAPSRKAPARPTKKSASNWSPTRVRAAQGAGDRRMPH